MRRMHCESKRRYLSGQEAELAAESYNSDIALVAYVMAPYYCRFHDCWHVGHDRYASDTIQRAYAVACRVRYQARHQAYIN